MTSTRIRLALSIAAGFGVLGLAAACGGGAATGNGGGNVAAGSGQGSTTSASTVGVQMVNGNKVLVDSKGDALYMNDQDSSGKPACTASNCVSIWQPLTVSAGQKPTAASGVGGTLGTVAIAGGKDQVTLNGKPLYTFALDGGPGQSHGNGFQDTFNGMHFSWHSAVPAGASVPSAGPSSAPAYNYGGGGGGGGY
ncbi:MAG TPA: hypothetical protein VJX10_07925 [Pseudonocardiaceae bacterium]|nr:hypothetical protein [Pseudonocardiaceae bacterium]